MKMFRLLTGMFALLMIALAGCGNQSPDFSSQLHSIKIKYTAIPPAPQPSVPPAPATKYAVGDQLQFTATGFCTTPPGTKVSAAEIAAGTAITELDADGNTIAFKSCSIETTKVTWSVNNTNGAITSTGLFTVKGPTTPGASGTVTVTGTADGLTDSAAVGTQTITTTSAVLRTLTISPETALIAQTEKQTFTVTGTNSDGTAATLVPGAIAWTSSNTAVATVAPATGLSTEATAIAVSGTSDIKATTTNANGETITVKAVLTVSGATLTGLKSDLKLSPASAAKPVNGTQNYQLLGVYSDGVTRPVPNSKIIWTVTPGTVATLATDASDNKTVATAKVVGLATIKATLTPAASSGLTDPSKNSATGTLTVVDARCSAPLSNQNTPAASINGAKTGVSGGVCLGCSVGSADNVINADPTDAASLSGLVALGLPDPTLIALTVNAGQLIPAGSKPGFIVNDPTGALLSANLLGSTIVVDTLDATGAVLETNGNASYLPSGLLINPLDLTLLGLGNTEGTVVALSNPTTSAFSAIRITFIPGLVGLLSTVNVSAACSSTAAAPTP